MSTVSTAVGEVVAAAREENAETVAAVVEQAAERVEAAQETAQAIADAAMQTELGRQINDLRGDYIKCQNDLQSLQPTISQMAAEMSEMKATLAASLTLQTVALAPNAPASVSLTPVVSEVKEATAEVIAALPGNLSESAVAESPVPEIPKPRKRFL